MARTRSKPQRKTTSAAWPASFRDSLFYWSGLLESRYNQLFIQAMRPQRVTVARYRTLSVLMEIADLTVNELARHSSIERSALSRLLDQMEREEMIVRRPSRIDRRAVQIRIMPKGRAALLAMRPVRRAVLRRAVEGIAPGEIDRMLTLMRRMLRNLDDVKPARKRGVL